MHFLRLQIVKRLKIENIAKRTLKPLRATIKFKIYPSAKTSTFFVNQCYRDINVFLCEIQKVKPDSI